MKPSDIDMSIVPPLIHTMEKAEREQAAALIVRTCHVLGDTWQPVTFDQVQGSLRDDIANKLEPWYSLLVNPFFRPNFFLLADGSYGRWIGEVGASAIEFTPRGIAALKKWSRA